MTPVPYYFILQQYFPGRGGWRVTESDPPVIEAGDGGEVPSLQDINARRAEAQALWEQIQNTPTLEQRMAALRLQMAAIIENLTEAQQAKFSTIRLAVIAELERGKPGVARRIVADTSVSAELEPAKAAILTLFDEL